jgi:cytidylate kinase
VSPRPVIAIDGPVGSGKSTAGRRLADRLGFVCLDSGLFYRAAAWAVVRDGIDPESVAEVVAGSRRLELRFEPDPSGRYAARVHNGAQDITDALFGPEVERVVSIVSRLPELRAALLKQQRAAIAPGGIVVLGRDIGTVVWPQAELKIFLDASPNVRVERKWRQRADLGDAVSRDQVAELLTERDRLDSARQAAPLRAAPDAVRLVTDDLTLEQVVDQIEALLRQRIPAKAT